MKTVLKIGLVLLALVAFTGCDAVLESFYPGFAPEETAVDGWLTFRVYIQDIHDYSPQGLRELIPAVDANDYTLRIVGHRDYDMLNPPADVYFYQYLAYSGSYEIYFSGPVPAGTYTIQLYANGNSILVDDFGSKTVSSTGETIIEEIVITP